MYWLVVDACMVLLVRPASEPFEFVAEPVFEEQFQEQQQYFEEGKL